MGEPELPESERTLSRWFNTGAFAAFAVPQAFGNAGIGIMRGPGLANFDFSLAKNFQVTERRYFQFRTEIFNAFNDSNFGNPLAGSRLRHSPGPGAGRASVVCSSILKTYGDAIVLEQSAMRTLTLSQLRVPDGARSLAQPAAPCPYLATTSTAIEGDRRCAIAALSERLVLCRRRWPPRSVTR